MRIGPDWQVALHRARLTVAHKIIGYSQFTGPLSIANDPADQARAVGAAVVVVYGEHSHTESGLIPYQVNNPDVVSTTSTRADARSSDGMSTSYTGTSSTRTSGGQSV